MTLDAREVTIATDGQNIAFSGKIFANPDAVDLKDEEFITITSGAGGVKLIYHMSIRHGLRPAHKYEFKMSEFDVQSAHWSYGDKEAVVSRLKSSVGLEAGRAENVLRVRVANADGAMLKIEPSDEQVRFVQEDESFLKKEVDGERRGRRQWSEQEIAAQFKRSATEREDWGLPEPPTSGLYGLGTRGARLKEIRDWKMEWGVR